MSCQHYLYAIFVVIGLFGTSSLFSKENIQLKVLVGEEINPYVEEITHLCLIVFREYPYLYEGTVGEYEPYIQKYADTKKGVVCLILDDNHLVGAVTGIPLVEMPPHHISSFYENGYDPSLFYYIGEMVLLPKHRGSQYGQLMYYQVEKKIKEWNFPYLCFCEIERPDHQDSPLFGKHGYIKHEELHFTAYWQEINGTEETPQHMVYWIKNLSAP